MTFETRPEYVKKASDDLDKAFDKFNAEMEKIFPDGSTSMVPANNVDTALDGIKSAQKDLAKAVKLHQQCSERWLSSTPTQGDP